MSTKLEASREAGRSLYALVRELFPLCRSLTGPGTAQTLEILQRRIPLEIRRIPSGAKVLDWQVPRQWSLRDAWIKNAAGQKVIDFNACNLHVVGYSTPVRRKMTWEELRSHLHTLPDRADWIPYRTSYYQPTWGFCLSQNQFDHMAGGEYEVCIDAELADGEMLWGELLLPGECEEEVLFSCHICHPSLANDNLSGIAVATGLAEQLAKHSRRYSYRFLFLPATIGAIAWLANNGQCAGRIRHGLVLTLLGDPGAFTYKKSRQGNAEIDRIMEYQLSHSGANYRLREFSPVGYDERQYCSPGFNLPVGCLMRTPHGEYPQYHTSADNLELVQPQYLAESLDHCLSAVNILEKNRSYLNQQPYGEPQLGKRGLYRALAGDDSPQIEQAILWVLNLSDGEHSLLDIAIRSGIPFAAIASAASLLCEHQLLAEFHSAE